MRKKRLISLGVLAVAVAAMVLAARYTVGPGYQNEPLKAWNPEAGYRHSLTEYVDGSDDMVFALAFSGGGTRAAAFAYGVLEELRDTPVKIGGQPRRLVDEVDFIAGVSGGSFPAAYFALHGDRIFEDFEDRFLKKDVEKGLIFRVLRPENWFRLLSPFFNRTDIAAAYFDDEIFEGATFGDIEDRDGARVVINTTDLSTGNSFHFVQDQFDFLCSDLTNFPVARAVAISAALPPYFPPLVLDNYAGRCGFEPPGWLKKSLDAGEMSFDRKAVNARILASYLDREMRPYIHLIDGGYSDNFGVRNPLGAAQATAEERSLDKAGPRPPGQKAMPRRIVAIVVNAQRESVESWAAVDQSRDSGSVFPIIANVQIDRYSLETLELLRSNFKLWKKRAQDAGALLDYHIIEVNFMAARDEEERNYLNQVPTALHLEPGDVDRLRDAARRILRQSPEFQRLRLALSEP